MKVASEFSWLKDLKDDGYQYIIMPKKNKKTFFATKANQKKDGTFRNDAKFIEVLLNKEDKWLPGDDSKNVFIRLDCPIKV